MDKYLMVPGREIAEVLGLFADWNPKESTLVISDGVTPAAVQEGNLKANVNGKMVLLETAPVIREGQLFIPMGFISYTFGFNADLDDRAAALTIAREGKGASDQWYLFKKDGTYQYIIVGTGPMISGAVIRTGKYSTSGNKIKLYNNKETWYPDISRGGQKEPYKNKQVGDEQGKFTLEDGGKTLKVIFDISTRFNKVSD